MAGSITQEIKNNWRKTWNSPRQRAQLIIGTIIVIVITFMMPRFFNMIQKRNGPVLHDAVLDTIPAHDVSLAIFTVIWGIGFYALWRGIQKPTIYITYSWIFIFVTSLRMLTIYFIPLSPPEGLIVLSDPLTGIFYGRSTITKDLFFSGHTSMLFMAFLCLERKWEKIVAITGTCIVACLLLVQHVHYTIDVIAAPIIIYPMFRVVKLTLNNASV